MRLSAAPSVVPRRWSAAHRPAVPPAGAGRHMRVRPAAAQGKHTLNDDKVPYNFGRASSLDELLHGAVRPGPDASTPHEGKVTEAQVREWAAFMQARGVRRVVGLLGPEELGDFERPPVEVLGELGVRTINVPLEGVPDPSVSMRRIEEELQDAEAAGDKVVVHCWGGSGRTGKVLAAWLVRRHGLSAADAAAEVVRFAGEVGTNRNASAEGVGKLLAVGTSSS